MQCVDDLLSKILEAFGERDAKKPRHSYLDSSGFFA